MGARDAIARALFDQWFGASKVVHPTTGKPLVVYRGEHGELPAGQVFQSRTPSSLSFGSQDAGNLYAEYPNNRSDVVAAPRVTPGYLKIEKPVIHDTSGDPFLDVSQLQGALGDREAARIARKYGSNIENTNNWEENYQGRFDDVADLLKREPGELKNLYFDAYHYLDDPTEIAKLRAKGFDGAIYGGSGNTALETEYRIFDPSQFRSAIPKIYSVPAGIGVAGAATQWPAIGETYAQDQYQ